MVHLRTSETDKHVHMEQLFTFMLLDFHPQNEENEPNSLFSQQVLTLYLTLKMTNIN